ncbi:hypothetical protein ES703_106274 [subsurface metagenome]
MIGSAACLIISAICSKMFAYVAPGVIHPPSGNQPRRKPNINNSTMPIQKSGVETTTREDACMLESTLVPTFQAAIAPREYPMMASSIMADHKIRRVQGKASNTTVHTGVGK